MLLSQIYKFHLYKKVCTQKCCWSSSFELRSNCIERLKKTTSKIVHTLENNTFYLHISSCYLPKVNCTKSQSMEWLCMHNQGQGLKFEPAWGYQIMYLEGFNTNIKDHNLSKINFLFVLSPAAITLPSKYWTCLKLFQIGKKTWVLLEWIPRKGEMGGRGSQW